MAKRIIIYGPSKIGISSFLAENKSAVFMDTFDSLGHLDIRKAKNSSSLELVYANIDKLIFTNKQTPEKNPYDTLVIDNLLGLERLIYKYVCKQNSIEDLEYLKYGKGHHLAFIELQRFLEKLDQLARPTKAQKIDDKEPPEPKSMNIIIAAHATTELYTTLYQENTARSVLSTTIKPPKENVAEYLKAWSDGLFYADDFQTVSGGYFMNKDIGDCGRRCIFTDSRPNFDAGNRFNRFKCHSTIPMAWEAFSEALEWVEKIPESVYESKSEEEAK